MILNDKNKPNERRGGETQQSPLHIDKSIKRVIEKGTGDNSLIGRFNNADEHGQRELLKELLGSSFDVGYRPSDLWEYIFYWKIFNNYPDLKEMAENVLITAGDVGLIHCYVRDKLDEGEDPISIYDKILKAAEKDDKTAYALLTNFYGLDILSSIIHLPGGKQARVLVEEYLINSNNQELIKKYIKEKYSEKLKECQINSSKLLDSTTKFKIVKNDILIQSMKMRNDLYAITIFSKSKNVVGTNKKHAVLFNKDYVDSIEPKTQEAEYLNNILNYEINLALNSNDYKEKGEYIHHVSLPVKTKRTKQRILYRIK